MRLAAAGLFPTDPRAAGPALDQIRAFGLAGASWHLPALAIATSAALADLRSRLRDAGIGLAQLLPPDYESLVDPDPGRRRAGLETLARCGEVASQLEADNLYVRPGSLNPQGAWRPHRDNHCPEVRERLVTSLREASRRAEEQGILLAVEGHVVLPLDTPETTRAVLEAVGSPALRFNFDLVNYVATLDDAYDTTRLRTRLFEQLGRYVQCVHLKDVTVEERLVLHIDETIPGRGGVDFAALLRGLEEVRPAAWLILEHMAPADLPEAIAAVRRAERSNGSD